MFASSKSKIALSLAAVTFGLGFAAAMTSASAKTFHAGNDGISHANFQPGIFTPGGHPAFAGHLTAYHHACFHDCFARPPAFGGVQFYFNNCKHVGWRPGYHTALRYCY